MTPKNLNPNRDKDELRPDHAGGKPVPDHEMIAEQARSARESAEAHNAQASIRDHMVEIGRGNQQAGRQSQ